MILLLTTMDGVLTDYNSSLIRHSAIKAIIKVRPYSIAILDDNLGVGFRKFHEAKGTARSLPLKPPTEIQARDRLEKVKINLLTDYNCIVRSYTNYEYPQADRSTVVANMVFQAGIDATNDYEKDGMRGSHNEFNHQSHTQTQGHSKYENFKRLGQYIFVGKGELAKKLATAAGFRFINNFENLS